MNRIVIGMFTAGMIAIFITALISFVGCCLGFDCQDFAYDGVIVTFILFFAGLALSAFWQQKHN